MLAMYSSRASLTASRKEHHERPADAEEAVQNAAAKAADKHGRQTCADMQPSCQPQKIQAQTYEQQPENQIKASRSCNAGMCRYPNGAPPEAQI